MKYVGYYRVSTKKQSRSGLGLDAQQQMVRQFAEANGLLVAEFVEVESGRNDQRFELAKAMNAAKKAGASLLIARLDRFSRRVSFIASMMDKGVQLLVAEMPHATDFQLHIFAALAQEERRLISERTKAALAQAKRRGTVLGKNGSALAAANKARAVDFANQVRHMLPNTWQLMSYSGLAKHLNEAGLVTINGNRFYAQTAKNLAGVLFSNPI
ncbi:recombinase family protein [Mesorhizobium sp. L2C084A000]|uniref:recombinase family protein n=1 Tax=Mesorhizobium sp. L2C084A000 TaxID=1287116 RepID=UPI0003D04CC0|nr:recombinase family protein [Mesorhizobium sp. L2C084A000]ESZ20016.1 DNA invertase [Mesorhizobium sp. L2C084A000]